MKPKDYYDDMRSVTGCCKWAHSVGLTSNYGGNKTGEIFLPGARGEINISLIIDNDDDDLDFINCMNRLRKWYESGTKGENK